MRCRWTKGARVLRLICVVSALLVPVAHARISCTHYLPDDLEWADIVCKGTLRSLRPAGHGTLPGSSPQKLLLAVLDVVSVVKGELPTGRTEVWGTENPFERVALWGTGHYQSRLTDELPAGGGHLFFLKRTERGLVFRGVDPNCFPVSAEPVDHLTVQEPRGRLRMELGAALGCDRREAVFAALLGLGDMQFVDAVERIHEFEIIR
jgi:hypothetical protein